MKIELKEITIREVSNGYSKDLTQSTNETRIYRSIISKI